MTAWWLTVGIAMAGYGDAVDGLPTPDDREVHLWTNVLRIDATYLQSRIGCWDKLEADERLAKLSPLAWDVRLAEAAHYHGVEMRDADPNNRGTALSHDSPDGTSFEDRVARFFDGSFTGENVAWNLSRMDRLAIAWMCSTGHRQNVLEPDYHSLGLGVETPYHVQVFAGFYEDPDPVLHMGAHIREDKGMALYVDLDAPKAPDAVTVHVDGATGDMRKVAGTAKRGVYRALAQDDGDCHRYHFSAEVDGETHRWPEEGRYGYGDCAFDDVDAGWFAPIPGQGDDDVATGCAHVPWTPGAVVLVGLLGLRRRR